MITSKYLLSHTRTPIRAKKLFGCSDTSHKR
nr:MAG TPA: hypothetical protein [Caudoviricetes sp.]